MARPPQQYPEKSPGARSGRVVTIRTTNALENLLRRYRSKMSNKELVIIDRSDAAFRILAEALKQWAIDNDPKDDGPLLPEEPFQKDKG